MRLDEREAVEFRLKIGGVDGRSTPDPSWIGVEQ
jgi:hypothetical protein